jgi:type II secretory pathway component PulM
MTGRLLAETPALPLHTAGKYVAAAYIVLFALVLTYVAIMAIRLSRIERQLGELLELSARPPASQDDAPEAGELDAVPAEATPV